MEEFIEDGTISGELVTFDEVVLVDTPGRSYDLPSSTTSVAVVVNSTNLTTSDLVVLLLNIPSGGLLDITFYTFGEGFSGEIDVTIDSIELFTIQ